MTSTLSNDATTVEEGQSQKITVYLLFLNVKAFDTFCEVDIQDKSQNWYRIGRSETIDHSHNPRFTTPFHIECDAGQQIRVTLKSKRGRMQGRCELSVDIFKSCNFNQQVLKNPVTGHMAKGHERGATVNVDFYKFDYVENNQTVSFELRAYALERMDNFHGRSSDPFFEVCRPHTSDTTKDVTWVSVYRSEWLKMNTNPIWEEFSIPLWADNGIDAPIRITVLDVDFDGNHDVIGHVMTTLNKLKEAVSTVAHSLEDQAWGKCPEGCMSILNPNTEEAYNPSTTGHTNSGFLQVAKCVVGRAMKIDMKAREDVERKVEDVHSFKTRQEQAENKEESKLTAKEEAECRMEEEADLKAEEDAKFMAKEEDMQKLLEKFEFRANGKAKREGMEKTASPLNYWGSGVGRCSTPWGRVEKCCLIM